MAEGSHVLISGLQHEAVSPTALLCCQVELNGREAVVEGFDSKEKRLRRLWSAKRACRYVVRLASELYRKAESSLQGLWSEQVLAEHLRLKEAVVRLLLVVFRFVDHLKGPVKDVAYH